MDQEKIINLLCMIPALVAGLTVHEFAHAWAADRLGDDTPRREGRLSLDPAVHIDPFGAIFFLIAAIYGYGIGWAKPVMTNPRNLKYPRRDSLLIAIAGPISNILQTPIWLLALFGYSFFSSKFGWNLSSDPYSASQLIRMSLEWGVVLNTSLAAFNMIPFPPLDGHWVLQAIGGRPIQILFDQIRPYSFILLILLINFTPVLKYALDPVDSFAFRTAFEVELAGINLAVR